MRYHQLVLRVCRIYSHFDVYYQQQDKNPVKTTLNLTKDARINPTNNTKQGHVHEEDFFITYQSGIQYTYIICTSKVYLQVRTHTSQSESLSFRILFVALTCLLCHARWTGENPFVFDDIQKTSFIYSSGCVTCTGEILE